MRTLLALREQAPAVFSDGGYRAIDVTGPHHDEVIAFARTSGRDAIIIAVGRLFARATQGGRHWPTAAAWDAALRVEGLTPVRNVLGAVRPATAPYWPIRDLFSAIPIAIIEARVQIGR